MPLGFQELVGGVGEVTLKGIDLQLQSGALVDIAAAIDVHIAFGVDGIVSQGVLHAVSADHRVTTAQFRATFEHRIDIGLPRNLFRLDVGRLLLADFGGNQLLQLAAGFELRRGQRGVPQAVRCALCLHVPSRRGGPCHCQGRRQRTQAVRGNLWGQRKSVWAHRRIQSRRR